MSSNETALDLDAIEARAGAATEGPWEAWISDSEHSKYEFSCSVITEDVGDLIVRFDAIGRLGNECHAKDDGRCDAEFMAAARTDVPALVAEVKSLRVMHSDALDIGMRAVISRNDARAERDEALAKVAAVREALRAFDGQRSGQRLGKTLAGTLWASVHTALAGEDEAQTTAEDECPHQGGKPLHCALCAGVSS